VLRHTTRSGTHERHVTGRCPCLVPDTAPLEFPNDLRPAVKDLVQVGVGEAEDYGILRRPG